MWRRLKRFLQERWMCWTKTCDYYEHYLAYGLPELTHEGYHAACRKCEDWQRRDSEYLERHPTALDSPYRKQCDHWERQVRA